MPSSSFIDFECFREMYHFSLSRVEESQEVEINNLAPQHNNSEDLNPQYESYVLMAFSNINYMWNFSFLGCSVTLT
jgi:hypothetical protein